MDIRLSHMLTQVSEGSEAQSRYYCWSRHSSCWNRADQKLALKMRAIIYRDFTLDEIEAMSCTELAEYVADEMEHSEWKDTNVGEHVLWDVPVDVKAELDLEDF